MKAKATVTEIKENKIGTSVNFDPPVLRWVDKKRGRVSRSLYINDLLKELKESEEQQSAGVGSR